MLIRPVCLSLLAALAVQGCATPPVAVVADQTDPMNDGRAKTCTATPVANGAGTITMTNDGWCSVALSDGGAPFTLGKLTTRPANGRIVVQKVGRESRIQYEPNERFTGSDQFTVALQPRAAGAPDVPVQVAVTVAAGEATTVSAPAIVAPPVATTKRRPAARPATPARRPTTR